MGVAPAHQLASFHHTRRYQHALVHSSRQQVLHLENRAITGSRYAATGVSRVGRWRLCHLSLLLVGGEAETLAKRREFIDCVTDKPSTFLRQAYDAVPDRLSAMLIGVAITSIIFLSGISFAVQKGNVIETCLMMA